MSATASLTRFLRSISGVSLPFAGLSWNPPPDETKIIYELLVRLADRRVLFDSYCGENLGAMMTSVEKDSRGADINIERGGSRFPRSPSPRVGTGGLSPVPNLSREVQS